MTGFDIRYSANTGSSNSGASRPRIAHGSVFSSVAQWVKTSTCPERTFCFTRRAAAARSSNMPGSTASSAMK